jgi:hypothetical protein
MHFTIRPSRIDNSARLAIKLLKKSALKTYRHGHDARRRH